MSEPLLSVKQLNLAFRQDVHRAWTLRQLAIDLLQSPAGAWRRAKTRIPVAVDINFDGHAGERIAIMGLNGAGKTSLCRCISGIYRPTSGSIAVSGNMRSVFSTSVGVQAELSGRENAHLLSEFLYPERRDKRRLVEDALDFSGLGEHLDSPFRLYSNGMQTRLFLSLISAAPSDILILDEVFDGADHVFAEKVSARMADTIQRSGLVLFVSHSEEQVRRLCNRLLLIERGRLVFDGGVEEGLRLYLPKPVPLIAGT